MLKENSVPPLAQVGQRPGGGQQAAVVGGEAAPEQKLSDGDGQQRRLLVQSRLSAAQQDQVSALRAPQEKIPL